MDAWTTYCRFTATDGLGRRNEGRVAAASASGGVNRAMGGHVSKETVSYSGDIPDHAKTTVAWDLAEEVDGYFTVSQQCV